MKNIGVDVDNLYISQPDNGEQALEITETMVRSGAIPPSPSAMSRLSDPVGIVSTFICALGSPSFMTVCRRV